MDVASQLKRGIFRQFSTGSMRKSSRFSLRRQSSLDPRLSNANRFIFGRQSSLDPNRRSPLNEDLTVPENLDSTMQMLFLACRGDVGGVEELLKDGVDVNSIDLDGWTALHIAACEGRVDVAGLLLDWKANVDARDRWGSTNTYQVATWNGTKVSVKVLDKESYSDPDSINAFKQESTLLQKVRHPNVVQFVGAVTQHTPMMIISEYHPKGDLGSYIEKKGRLKTYKALRFARDIARGMNYLHEWKPDPIIHCDLKPKNILLDGGGHLKVAGFGLVKLSKLSLDKARLAHPEDDTSNRSLYMAPEVYKNEIFDKKVDSFSFGLILYEMIEGTPPFPLKAPDEVAQLICLEGLRPSLKKQ